MKMFLSVRWQLPRISFHIKRKLSTTYVSQEIIFKKTGEPSQVLEINETKLPSSLKPNEVVIKILAAPVHPADINVINGVYGKVPTLPAVPGLECAVKVLETGSQVKSLKCGDRALFAFRGWGTWRTHHICPEHHLIKVPDYVSTVNAAIISTNPGTATRLLTDFIPLKKNDTVIQNTANSAVGQAVIQFARDRGIRTINIIRNRENIEELKAYLTGLGADCVITDEDLRLPATKDLLSKFGSPSLALNGAGGRILSDMIRYVSEHGTVVTYGGMTRQPVTIPTSVLIFKNITFRGFWYNRWIQSQNDSSLIRNMIEDLFRIVAQNNFRPPNYSLVPFHDYKVAVSRAMEPFSGNKQILVTENVE